MVQINKNVNVKTTQLTKTVKVDTAKSTGTKKTEPQKHAVWILRCEFTGNGMQVCIPGAKKGDKIIMLGPDNKYVFVELYRDCGKNGLSEVYKSYIDVSDIEADRGDITNPDAWSCFGGY